jgi:hypothetical protein
MISQHFMSMAARIVDSVSGGNMKHQITEIVSEARATGGANPPGQRGRTVRFRLDKGLRERSWDYFLTQIDRTIQMAEREIDFRYELKELVKLMQDLYPDLLAGRKVPPRTLSVIRKAFGTVGPQRISVARQPDGAAKISIDPFGSVRVRAAEADLFEVLREAWCADRSPDGGWRSRKQLVKRLKERFVRNVKVKALPMRISRLRAALATFHADFLVETSPVGGMYRFRGVSTSTEPAPVEARVAWFGPSCGWKN